MKPKLKDLKDGVRKLNKFGKGEHAGAAVGTCDDKDGHLELNIACVQWEDAKDKDNEWCCVCYDNKKEEVHGDVVVNVKVNNDNIGNKGSTVEQ